MTSKDKDKQIGGKVFSREKKPFDGPRKPRAAERDGEAPRRAAPAATHKADKAGEPERISKLLARAGVASRRDAERMIMEGRVRLNGVVLETPVVLATFADTIEVDGKQIRGIERTRLWLYHKPAGLVTTNADPEGRPTVFDNLPAELPRVMSIGRLDINTEGLLLLTNDGGLSRVLELPATGWLRRYRVRAHGSITQDRLDALKDGIAVDGVLYGAIEATLDREQGSNVWITMGLREGKNREIKNVLGALGLDVNRLIRISYGPFQLGELPEGDVQEIRGRTLRDQLGPRLIEDSGADFDAPIFDEPVKSQIETDQGDWSKKTKQVDPEAAARTDRTFREKPADRRERDRDRLDTKPQAKSFGAKKFDEDPPRRAAVKNRTSNVWMAPGARPVAEKKKGEAAEVAEKPLRRERPEGAPATKRYGRTKDGKPVKSKQSFDPDRKAAKLNAWDKPDTGPRVVANRTRDEEGEWIRSSDIVRKEEGGKRGFGDKKPRGDFGDRPPRGDSAERSFKPREDRARDDRPRGERPARAGDDRPARGDKPFSKSFGDRKPRAEGAERPARSGDARPARGDKPFSKPFGDRKPRAEGAERSERPARSGDARPPRGDKPFGDRKPSTRSFGDKPAGGDRPRTGKPSGPRPTGGKPSGPRPGGGAGGPRRGGGGKPSGSRG